MSIHSIQRTMPVSLPRTDTVRNDPSQIPNFTNNPLSLAGQEGNMQALASKIGQQSSGAEQSSGVELAQANLDSAKIQLNKNQQAIANNLLQALSVVPQDPTIKGIQTYLGDFLRELKADPTFTFDRSDFTPAQLNIIDGNWLKTVDHIPQNDSRQTFSQEHEGLQIEALRSDFRVRQAEARLQSAQANEILAQLPDPRVRR